jgi:predicted CopG family antitoxin
MKAIKVRDTTYGALVSLMQDGDDLSDVIDRLAGKKTCDIHRYAGALQGSKVLDDLMVLTNAMRRSGRTRL